MLWLIVGPSGPSREKVTISISKEYGGLAANEKVSKKKIENEKISYQWYSGVVVQCNVLWGPRSHYEKGWSAADERM